MGNELGELDLAFDLFFVTGSIPAAWVMGTSRNLFLVLAKGIVQSNNRTLSAEIVAGVVGSVPVVVQEQSVGRRSELVDWGILVAELLPFWMD